MSSLLERLSHPIAHPLIPATALGPGTRRPCLGEGPPPFHPMPPRLGRARWSTSRAAKPHRGVPEVTWPVSWQHRGREAKGGVCPGPTGLSPSSELYCPLPHPCPAGACTGLLPNKIEHLGEPCHASLSSRKWTRVCLPALLASPLPDQGDNKHFQVIHRDPVAGLHAELPTDLTLPSGVCSWRWSQATVPLVQGQLRQHSLSVRYMPGPCPWDTIRVQVPPVPATNQACAEFLLNPAASLCPFYR